MADLQNFTITPGAVQQITAPTYTLSGRLIDSTTGAVIADFTGANSLTFLQIFAALSAADRTQFMNQSAAWLISKHFGLS